MQARADFRCRQYQGNDRSFMNSVVTVETPVRNPTSRYFVALISNALRQNSTWDHSRIAAAIHEMVLTRKAVQLRGAAKAGEIDSAGKSD
jgi:hypothetical protein